ncbi:surface lipoprotein assembly modifier [Nitratireductor thuwali]|uniref:Surface lipoprotein assembly modifier C-terminal domain-containing protein n=1 Tax=Nitratireductor thuwali TaxID=2267699 RepID=A0ABY5MQ77_9HYPH|nr:hypothetical protein NTH_04143 [Nitratireductor thuwali]
MIIPVVALFLAVMVSPAHSRPGEDIDRYIVAGRIGEAGALAARLAADDAGNRWLLAYVRGYACLASGDASCSEAEARRMIASEPGNAHARHLLINALLAQRRHKAAVFHIRRNLALIRDPAVERQYREALAAYRKRNPDFGASISLTAMPSDNVNRGTGQDTIYLNGLPFRVGSSSREESGSTVTGSLTVYRKFALGEAVDLVIAGSGTVEKAVEHEGEDVYTLAPSAQLQFDVGRARLSMGPVGEVQWRDDALFAYRWGGAASMARGIFDNTDINLSLRMEAQRFPDRPYLDGWRLIGRAGIRHQVSHGLFASLGIEGRRESTEAEHLTYNMAELSAGLEKYWKNGFYTDIQLDLGIRRYDAAGVLSADPRRDQLFRIQAGVAHEAISLFGMMPYVGYRYTKNDSNLSLYSYESSDLIISGRKRF